MDWDEYAQVNWHEVRDKIREQWADLTDDDIAEIGGCREKLIGKIQQRYVRSYGSAWHGFETWRLRHFESNTRPTIH